MRSGLRPIHSVDTITCTSEMSGTASSGVLVIAHAPQSATTSVPVNTRKRLDAHQSMIRSIMVRLSHSTPLLVVALNPKQRLADANSSDHIGGSPCRVLACDD